MSPPDLTFRFGLSKLYARDTSDTTAALSAAFGLDGARIFVTLVQCALALEKFGVIVSLSRRISPHHRFALEPRRPEDA